MPKFIINESPNYPKSIQNKVWGRPGSSQGRLGDHFGPRMVQGLKMAPNNREKVIFFLAPKSGLGPAFRGLVFHCLRECSFYDFYLFWVPEASIGASFSPRRSIFAALGCGCVSMMILLRICLVCCCFGFPF